MEITLEQTTRKMVEIAAEYFALADAAKECKMPSRGWVPLLVEAKRIVRSIEEATPIAISVEQEVKVSACYELVKEYIREKTMFNQMKEV